MDFSTLRGWGEIAAVVPLVTATAAVFAYGLARRTLHVNRQIAQKRAAIDFFMKTETDNYMLSAWRKYEAARIALMNEPDLMKFKGEEKESCHWIAIREYLFLHELMAVGVFGDVFDEDICFNYWRNVLFIACEDCRRVIEHIQKSERYPGEPYSQLLTLHADWKKCMAEQKLPSEYRQIPK